MMDNVLFSVSLQLHWELYKLNMKAKPNKKELERYEITLRYGILGIDN